MLKYILALTAIAMMSACATVPQLAPDTQVLQPRQNPEELKLVVIRGEPPPLFESVNSGAKEICEFHLSNIVWPENKELNMGWSKFPEEVKEALIESCIHKQ